MKMMRQAARAAMFCAAALLAGMARAGADISQPGDQFAGQYANGYAINNVTNVVDGQADDAVFPDNMDGADWKAQGHGNCQNVSISAGTYKPDGTFDQRHFNAISTVRIWTLCTDGEKQRIPSQVAINYTSAENVAWNNWYTTGDKSIWMLPVTISAVNGKPVKANADGSVTLYDGKENAFIGTKPGTQYTYVDLSVDIPAGTTSVLFQFGPQGPTNHDPASGRTFGDRIAEIQTVPGGEASVAAETAPSNIIIHSGQKVAFLGDSITAAGWESPLGYVRLVSIGLALNGVKIAPIPAGVSGNTSSDMLSRFDRDVISKKPDWVTISCGVNDVWHGASGVALEPYEKNMTEVVDKAQAAGVKVVMLTATMIGEDQPNENNQKLIAYNDFLRKLAAERHFPLADLNAEMQEQVGERIKAGWQPGHLLTVDGVHMNPRGDVMMATGILKAMGLTDAQITKVKDAWMDMPNTCPVNVAYEFKVTTDLTLAQYLKLQSLTPKDSGVVPELLQSICNTDFPQILAPGDPDGIGKIQQKALEKIDQQLDQKAK